MKPLNRRRTPETEQSGTTARSLQMSVTLFWRLFGEILGGVRREPRHSIESAAMRQRENIFSLSRGVSSAFGSVEQTANHLMINIVLFVPIIGIFGAKYRGSGRHGGNNFGAKDSNWAF